MDIYGFLEKEKCTCGKNHTCDVAYVAVGENAISDLRDWVDGYTSILLVADENT